MNKNNGIDDSKIASNEDIVNMNREYSSQMRPENLIKMACILSNQKSQNHHICTLDYDNIARAYFLEKDIIVSLNFLYQKARQNYTKCTIKNIIKIKECVEARLLALYIKGKGHTLNYAPNIIDRPTYNALYNEINYMQCELLSRIEDIKGLYQILSKEHTATLMLHSIKP